jgi:DNA invertase Pin-like site-specific DNA recombinase
MLIGYARVSTSEQETALQAAALKAAGWTPMASSAVVAREITAKAS